MFKFLPLSRKKQTPPPPAKKTGAWIKTYYIFLAINLLMTAVFMIPTIAITFIYITAGIGFFVEGINLYLTVILLSLLPAVLLRKHDRLKWLGFALSIALPAIVLGGPSAIGKFQAHKYFAQTPQQPAQFLAGPLPKSIELKRYRHPIPYMPGAKTGESLGKSMCEATCQGLLLSGEVDWLRIRLTELWNPEKYAPSEALFAMADGSECHALYSGMPDDAPCIVFRDDGFGAADLVITVREIFPLKVPHQVQGTNGQNRWLYEDQGYATPTGERTITATFGSGDDAPLAFSRTQRFAEYSNFMVQFDLYNWGEKGGLHRRPRRLRSSPIFVADELENLGLSLVAPHNSTDLQDADYKQPEPPTAWQNALAASLFKTTAGPENSIDWTKGKTDFIDAWLSATLAMDQIKPEIVRLICQLKPDHYSRTADKINRAEEDRGPFNCR